MLTPLSVIAIIMLTLGAVGIFVFFPIFMYKDDTVGIIVSLLISGLIFLLPGTLMILNTPLKSDVCKGNAHYVKEVNYQEYDTVTTYRIEFNEDWWLGKTKKRHNPKNY